MTYRPHILAVVEALDDKHKRSLLIHEAVDTWDRGELVDRVTAEIATDYEDDNEGFAEFVDWNFHDDAHLDESLDAAQLDPVA